MKDDKYDKAMKVRKVVRYVNFPLLCAIPAVMYTDILLAFPAAKQIKIISLLHLADFALLMNTGLLYMLIKTLVSKIDYCPKEETFIIK